MQSILAQPMPQPKPGSVKLACMPRVPADHHSVLPTKGSKAWRGAAAGFCQAQARAHSLGCLQAVWRPRIGHKPVTGLATGWRLALPCDLKCASVLARLASGCVRDRARVGCAKVRRCACALLGSCRAHLALAGRLQGLQLCQQRLPLLPRLPDCLVACRLRLRHLPAACMRACAWDEGECGVGRSVTGPRSLCQAAQGA